MTENALQFDNEEPIGTVVSVDTSRALINVDDDRTMTNLSIGDLVAVRGKTANDYLIGIIERATRVTSSSAIVEEEDAEGNIPIGESQADAVRIVLVGTFIHRKGEDRNVFKRGADSFPQIDRDCYLIAAGNLQRFMGLLSSAVEEGQRLTLGTYVSDKTASAIASGDKFFQRHAAILGSTGSGKSWAVALILEKANALDYANIVVFDMHGEYKPLSGSDAFANYFKIAGPGDLDRPRDESLFLPYWLLNREEMLAMILDRSDQNAPNQATRFTDHVRRLKDETLVAASKEDVRQTFTVDSPIYYDLGKLVTKLKHDDEERVKGTRGDKNGPWNGKLTRFISRLEAKREDRRYGFLFRPPASTVTYNWLSEQMVRILSASKGSNGIKIVDFSEVPSDILPIVTGVFARLLYDVQFWLEDRYRTPVCLVCDEAHLYLPVKGDAEAAERRALETFERIAKEGRKYGFSLLVVSQRPSDVSRTILSQCNNFLVLRLTNDRDQTVIRRLMPDSMAGIVDVLPLLETGEAILLGDAVLLPTRIRLDKPSIRPSSATRDFWSEWATAEPSNEAIKRAVETMRRQTRAE